MGICKEFEIFCINNIIWGGRKVVWKCGGEVCGEGTVYMYAKQNKNVNILEMLLEV